MKKLITIVQGHTDPKGRLFGHALAEAYSAAASDAGFRVEMIDVARLPGVRLQTPDGAVRRTPPAAIREAQQAIADAEHLVIFCPLWLGAMPAQLRAFWAQIFPSGAVDEETAPARRAAQPASGKSARLVVTTGMPATFYRWYFGTYELKGLERNFLGHCGIGTVHENLIGLIEGEDARRRDKWLERMRGLGRSGA
jgi:putative NADPH-quinone reductase